MFLPSFAHFWNGGTDTCSVRCPETCCWKALCEILLLKPPGRKCSWDTKWSSSVFPKFYLTTYIFLPAAGKHLPPSHTMKGTTQPQFQASGLGTCLDFSVSRLSLIVRSFEQRVWVEPEPDRYLCTNRCGTGCLRDQHTLWQSELITCTPERQTALSQKLSSRALAHLSWIFFSAFFVGLFFFFRALSLSLLLTLHTYVNTKNSYCFNEELFLSSGQHS